MKPLVTARDVFDACIVLLGGPDKLRMILSGRRHNETVRERELIVGAVREIPWATPSFPEIARLFNMASHSTSHTQYQRWLAFSESDRTAWLSIVSEQVAKTKGLLTQSV